MKFKPRFIFCFLAFACSNTGSEKLSIVNNYNPTLESQSSLKDTVTFSVDSVQLSPALMPVYAMKDILQWKTGKEITYFPINPETDSLVYLSGINGLLQTVHNCYDQHRPLVLNPDAIWLTICQGVSIHINQHFDSLSSTLFKANKPDVLIARNDSLASNSEEWASLIADLSLQTKKYTLENAYNFFVPKFSTTSSINTMAYQITLLEVYK